MLKHVLLGKGGDGGREGEGGREGRKGVEVEGVDQPEEGVREGGSEGVRRERVKE